MTTIDNIGNTYLSLSQYSTDLQTASNSHLWKTSLNYSSSLRGKSKDIFNNLMNNFGEVTGNSYSTFTTVRHFVTM